MSGADNVQKRPLLGALNEWGDRQTFAQQSLLGKALPATVKSVDETGTIVTITFQVLDDVVKLPEITCSLVTTEYNRPPIQPGTKGLAIPAQVYLGAMSGLGDGQATFDQQPNLTNLVFLPMGNANYGPNDNQQMYLLYGPNGVILRDAEGTAILEVQKDGGIVINAALGGNIIKANLVEANDDADAKGKGIPFSGFYRDPDGVIHFQRIPD